MTLTAKGQAGCARAQHYYTGGGLDALETRGICCAGGWCPATCLRILLWFVVIVDHGRRAVVSHVLCPTRMRAMSVCDAVAIALAPTATATATAAPTPTTPYCAHGRRVAGEGSRHTRAPEQAGHQQARYERSTGLHGARDWPAVSAPDTCLGGRISSDFWTAGRNAGLRDGLTRGSDAASGAGTGVLK